MDWILGSGLRFGRLVVALAIGLTVIGIAQLHSAPVDVYPHPLAVVILGGLVTSTLLSLFVLPSLYLRFGHRRNG